jgi:branched-subunit amino acid transport protein AzlD
MDGDFIRRTGVGEAAAYAFAMGALIFFCRAFPFIFFRDRAAQNGEEGLKDPRKSFLALVEKIVPPVAMTVLAFNAITAPLKGDRALALPVLAASALTALLHVWKRNPLFSIAGGTALYMALTRF